MQKQQIKPGPGQESVWNYPRPPRLEPTDKPIEIYFNDVLIAKTNRAWRVLETSHPPTYYIPPEDVEMAYLRPGHGRSHCEWKGQARYYTVQVGDKTAENAAWFYPTPISTFEPIKNHIAFYPAPMDRCTVAGEVVRSQVGGFYGGWITSDIVGPFKGEPDTMGW
jgi:uncharacterized protein (DUF427 family)